MKLTKSERMELQRQANARNGRADSARRARLVLLLADGFTWAEIRTKLDCGDSYSVAGANALRRKDWPVCSHATPGVSVTK